ncbi:MAG: transposase [Candidatus Omnitrophica bacterium]|nr:transposase [Candidatus Omnitrophota bacterium]MDD5430493.1 transposase [Candidatus Omnitrophota bacterium]
MDKFPKRKLTRLKKYDYSQTGYYFVTICTQNRKEIFASIKNNQIILNEFGRIVKKSWLQIPEHFKNIELDKYIIMPNHIHTIINIVGAGSPRPLKNHDNDDNKIIGYSIGRGNLAPTKLGQVMAFFKYQTTKQINKLQNRPGIKIWQRRYHDHIIRNDKSLNRIREYIDNNPKTWDNDIENPIRLGAIESELINV